MCSGSLFSSFPYVPCCSVLELSRSIFRLCLSESGVHADLILSWWISERRVGGAVVGDWLAHWVSYVIGWFVVRLAEGSVWMSSVSLLILGAFVMIKLRNKQMEDIQTFSLPDVEQPSVSHS